MVLQWMEGALHVAVDPSCPDAWRRAPYYSRLREMTQNGLQVEIRVGHRFIELAEDQVLGLARANEDQKIRPEN
jgi:hypothetical protein